MRLVIFNVVDFILLLILVSLGLYIFFKIKKVFKDDSEKRRDFLKK